MRGGYKLALAAIVFWLSFSAVMAVWSGLAAAVIDNIRIRFKYRPPDRETFQPR